MPSPDLHAELEIGLHSGAGGTYQVEVRFTDPDSQAERAPVRGHAPISLEHLLSLQMDPQKYGLALADYLFHDETVRSEFAQAKAAVESTGRYLRLRILIGVSAPELNGLRWELLVDPATKARLSTSERILLSRFMVSSDWRRIELRPKGELRALIAVASAANLGEYQLPEIDVEGEIRRAAEAMPGIQLSVLGRDQPATLDRIADGIRDDIDILYLVCHGAMLGPGISSRADDFESGFGESAEETVERQLLLPYLFLEKETRTVEVVSGGAFARRIGDLRQLPRLIVLASCESAGKESGATFQSALAPRLAKAGVPAVIAMQGTISMETVALALPKFFSELMIDGQIDRAMAAARARVRERADNWMPALFLRLKGGRIWYEPGFGGEDAVKWEGLATAINSRKFTPIVGWGLAEAIYGCSPRGMSCGLWQVVQVSRPALRRKH